MKRYRLAGTRFARLWDAHGRPVAGAMTTTGSGALTSGLLSAVAAKILATVGGPAALATLVTLQQVRQGAIVAATVNGQTALIQGASARAGQARREYVRTAAVLFLASTLTVAAALLAFPGSLWRMTGLAPVSDSAVRWLAISVLFSSVFVFLTALLNSLHRIGTLAALQIVAPLALALGMWPAVQGRPAPFAGGELPATFRAMPLALLLASTAAISAAVAARSLASGWVCWRDWILGRGALWSRQAARAFLSVAGAMLVSGLFASATVLAVRERVMEHQGLTVAGWFDAAWNISMNHASLLLASLQTYCLPALSRAKSAREQSAHIAGVWMLAMPAAAAMIAVLAFAKPWVIALLYAPSFRPASAMLRWTLLGDYCKIGSWILSLPLLARADMKAFLLLDTVACATFAGAAVVLSRWLPAGESAAAAFACMYAVHLVAGATLAHARCGIRLERAAVVVWSGGLALVVAVSACAWNRL
jgi:PST family polysaccharide transporter